MKKRLIATLIFAVTLIYLSISVSAVGTFGNTGYIIASPTTTSTVARTWQTIELKSSTDQDIGITSGSSQTWYIWNAYKTNQVIQDGYIIVITITLDNVTSESAQLIGAGQLTSDTLPTNSTTAVKLNAINLNQQIIASTISDTGTHTRLTVTFKASGFVNQYPVCAWKITKNGTLDAIQYCDAELYETVEDAAGSGMTPEEMREVLSSWGEEELLPGIQDSVESGVQSGMQAALEDEKQQANTDGNSAIDELTGALDGVVGDINQAKEAFNTLGSALQYSGTSASLTFPGMNVPFLGQISEPINFDITGYIDSTFPPQLLLLIRCAFSIGIVSYPIFELVRQLRKLLDKG